MAQEVYDTYLHEYLTVDEIALQRGIKPDSVRQYISKCYNPDDAETLMRKLDVNEETVVQFNQIMKSIQTARSTHTNHKINSENHSLLLTRVLEGKCSDIELSKKLLGRIYKHLF
jgi:hypothetical protein